MTRRTAPWLVTALALLAVVWPSVRAQVNVANNAAQLAGKTIALNEVDATVTGLWSFSRTTNPPFAVNANAAKVSNLNADTVDGLDSTRFLWAVITTTSTGTQNDFAPGITTGQNTIIRCNNASLLTITGVAGGVDGQHLWFVSIGAGEVDFPHQNGGSAAGNRYVNIATSGATPLAPGSGVAEYVYDGTTVRWRLTNHEQGAWITPTFAAGNYIAGGAQTWTLQAGDVNTQRFYLRGRTLTVAMYLDTTSVGGTPATTLRVSNGAWGGFTISGGEFQQFARVSDNGGANVLGFVQAPANGTTLNFYVSIAGSANWTAATNTTVCIGIMLFEVT